LSSWLQAALISVASVLASSGFWAYILRKDDTKDATTRLLMGLAYDKVTTLGILYLERGWITRDELDEYGKYFFGPYKALGGNGVAERIWMEVKSLPFRPYSKYEEIIRNKQRNERFIPDVPVISTTDQSSRSEQSDLQRRETRGGHRASSP
jgi:hypothetical protein